VETDERLYQRVREDGDMAAFDVLYARYEAQLFGFLVRTLESRADAEDVFHDAFLNALRSREVKFEQGSFRSWLFRIAKNLCSNRRRSEGRGSRAVAALPEPASAPSAEASIEERQLHAALDDAVSRLPPALSEIYHLRSSGLSYEEMAHVLSVPLGTLKSRMNQMVGILREEVKPWTAT
jgi:RNA polymerase sigma-70 factor (ECF subfamily)